MEHVLDTASFLVNKSVKKTWKVSTSLPVEYEIKYSTDIFNIANKDLLEYGASSRRFVAIDKTVFDMYRDKIEGFFFNKSDRLLLFSFKLQRRDKKLW